MLTGQSGVKYGLTVPKKQAKEPVKKQINVFGDDNESEDDRTLVEKQIKRQARQKQTDKKVAQMQAAALAEDPSIFDYDAHYDTVQQEKARARPMGQPDRSSKYIQNLMDKTKERKREQDIVYERRLLRERKAEDHLFGDKERFVTAAYKKKLEEDQRWLEEEKLRDQVEAAQDVRRIGMNDFYSNLLTNNVAMGTAKPSSRQSAPSAAPAAPQEAPSTFASDAQAGPVREEQGKASEDPQWERMVQAREAFESAQAAKDTAPPVEQDHLHPDDSKAAGMPASRVQEIGANGGLPESGPVSQDKEQKNVAEAKMEQPQASKADKAAAARERFLARKRKATDA